MNQSVILKADRPRGLRYSTSAFCKVEEITGKTIFELNEGAGMIEMRAMLYCGLYWEDKQLTLEDTGEIMDVILQNDDIEYLSEKIAQAVEMATGNNRKTGKKHKKGKRNH